MGYWVLVTSIQINVYREVRTGKKFTLLNLKGMADREFLI
jgi:hypothetical protein